MSCVASYDMEPFTGQSMAELTAYVNRMNELLRYVLHNLDEENMTDAYAQEKTGESGQAQ